MHTGSPGPTTINVGSSTSTTTSVTGRFAFWLSPPGSVYGNRLHCSMVLFSGDASNAVTLTLTSVALESGFDFLTVYDGSTDAAPVLAVVTGTSSTVRLVLTTATVIACCC